MRSRQYVPCAAPVCDLARRPFTDLVSALSVFSDQIILPADGPDLKRAALSAFKDALVRIESRYQPQLLRVLKERFDRLTASDPAYVGDKFVRSWEPVLPGKVRAPSLRDDKVFIAEMRTIASGPLARRARAFPFPASIEVLFA